MLLAGAAALALASAAGVPDWWALPLLPLFWFGLIAAGRALHAWNLRRTLIADGRSGRRSASSIAVDAAVRLRRSPCDLAIALCPPRAKLRVENVIAPPLGGGVVLP